MFLQIHFRDALLAALLASIIYFALAAIYNLYFHSLSRFPGPRLWAISRIPYAYNLFRGDLAQRTKELHDYYGKVVRQAPNEVSFTEGQAWQDIYNHHQGRPKFPKNPLWMSPAENGIHSILSANNADHARYRRLLSHAFSENALREQEYLPLAYIDLLIRRLHEVVASSGDKGAVVDIVKWLNFTTFDIVGDLALGESFSCLEKSQYHGWVSILFSQFKFAGIFISLRFFGLDKPLRMVLPKSLLRKRAEHAQYSKDRIHHRLDQGKHGPDAQRNDFMAYVLRHNDEKGMTVPEIEQTFRVLVVAGSETTGTALSGIFYNLLQSPDMMEKLAKEIRQSFPNASEICANKASNLPYLNAVIEEGLRLCPPVPLGLPRVVPTGGATVSSQWLTGGTFVSCPGYASNRSSLNFPNSPSTFDSSRWLQPSRPSKADPSAFNPFSLGPRKCLGRNLAYLEMRLMLAYLLWHFDFEAEGKAWTWEDQKTWILWEKKPLNVRIRNRSV